MYSFPYFSFLYLYVLLCKLRFSKYRRDVEWMMEFQQVARIATWRPWNKQVVSEVTSWNEMFFCILKRKKNVVWWNKLKWLLNVFHHNMKLYCLGMGIKELSLKGSGSVWRCNKSNKVLQHSPVLLILYHINKVAAVWLILAIEQKIKSFKFCLHLHRRIKYVKLACFNNYKCFRQLRSPPHRLSLIVHHT